jgi:hypothetical protein
MVEPLTRLALAVLAPAFIAACDRHDERPPPKPALGVSVLKVARGPAETTRVVVALTNSRSMEQQLRGLAGQVVLRDRGGAALGLHRVSLGVGKPVVVPPNATIEVPLLFEGTIGSAAQLTFLGVDVSVPRPP